MITTNPIDIVDVFAGRNDAKREDWEPKLYAVVSSVFSDKALAVKNVLSAQLAVAEVERELETKQAELTLSGSIMGSNKETREAAAHAVLANEYTNLDFYKSLLMKAKTELELVSNNLRLLDMLIELNTPD